MSVPAASSRHNLQLIARRAMLERGLWPVFGPSVVAELQGIAGPAVVSDGSVRDLRGLLWSSIDNDDSLDLDQLEVADVQDGTRIKLLVAIADVDALVVKASAIDVQAAHNTTSVYTVAQVFPMLPERLSTDLTSLRQGEARPAIVVEMVIEPDGAVAASDLYRAEVVNHAKLAYNSVAAWLDGQGPMPPAVAAVPGMADQLRLQDRGAQALRMRRLRSGALTLQTIGRSVVTCTAGHSQGEYTGTKTESLALTLTGCETVGRGRGVPCQSKAAAAGEVLSAPLAGELEFTNETEPLKPVVGWDLEPAASGPLAAFECGGSPVTVSGSVISPVTAADKMLTEFKVKSKAIAGKQVPEEFEGGSKDTLTLGKSGAEEQAGLTATDVIADEEALEIKGAVVVG